MTYIIAAAWPSTTPSLYSIHFHLYIRQDVPWLTNDEDAVPPLLPEAHVPVLFLASSHGRVGRVRAETKGRRRLRKLQRAMLLVVEQGEGTDEAKC